MPLIETKGAASAQGFGEFAQQTAANYIEDVFSTWLYTGNGSTQTITNGIDLSTKGGMVWLKSRSNVSRPELVDTARGTNSALYTNGTDAAGTNPSVYNFLSSGFQVGVGTGWGNENAYTYASWTFRKQPKFFDIVTYTGDGSSSRAINHSLESVPGCVIVKSTSNNREWRVWHRSLSFGQFGYLSLNLTSAETFGGWGGANTSTQFYVSTDITGLNASGETYVAYLFAHNAGGFGLTGTDNVISCGSVTSSSVGALVSVTLGYEPQFLLIKQTTGTDNQGWYLVDNMRGLTTTNSGGGANAVASLFAQSSAAENSSYSIANINATGFALAAQGAASSNQTFIYIAIRRGPMKTPTTGTSVFSNNLETTTTNPQTLTTGFPVDLNISTLKGSAGAGRYVVDRLRGTSTSSYRYLLTNATDAEATTTGAGLGFDNNTGMVDSSYWNSNGAIFWSWRRAPGFFDVVCYTGNATNGRSITHNLGVVPEILIVKKRSSGAGWPTLITSEMRVMEIDIDSGYKSAASTKFFYGDGSSDIAPTSSVFTVASGGDVNGSGSTYVAYLFASVAGVSKVGSYTGTGALQTINCGFTGGARFVLIKRTDSTGGWFVYDSARGIGSGNDPYLLLDTTDAEVTGTNYVDTTSVGFQVTAAAPAELNANGGSYIFLAIS